MAQHKSTPSTSEPAPMTFQPSDWQDADFVRALASLERLQQQLDQLRKVPQDLVTPFRTSQSPHQVFSSFNAARQQSFAQISELRSAWEEPKTAQLFQQCNRTQEKHVDLVQQHDIGIWGWKEREQGLGSGVAQRAEQGELSKAGKVGVQVRNSEEDEKTASALFGPEFKQFEWSEGGAKGLAVVQRPGPWLSFEVQRRQTADGVAYEARCVDDTQEAEAISRCLYRRSGQQDVFETLATLLAYGDSTLIRANCEICGKYRDSSGAVPSARRRRQKDVPKAQVVDEVGAWSALHEGCLDLPTI